MVEFFSPDNESEVKRRRLMAEQIRQQAMPKPTEVVSGYAVPQSPLAGLASMLSQGVAGYQSQKADEIEQNDAKMRQQFLLDAIKGAGGDSGLLAEALMSNPAYVDQGIKLYGDTIKKQEMTPYQEESINIRREAMQQKEDEKAQKRADMMDAEGRRATHAFSENSQTRAKIDELLANETGIDKVTGLSSYLPNVSDSARNAQADIDTLKARSAFGGLQEMRMNSPTGGALGQVAVQELEMLKNAEASLQTAQSAEEYTRSLKEYKAALDAADKAVAEAYRDRYGEYPNGYIAPTAGVDATDPRVQKAKELGYTDEEIAAYLKGR